MSLTYSPSITLVSGKMGKIRTAQWICRSGLCPPFRMKSCLLESGDYYLPVATAALVVVTEEASFQMDQPQLNVSSTIRDHKIASPQFILGSAGPCLATSSVVWLFLRGHKQMSINARQLGHWWQKEITSPKPSLVTSGFIVVTYKSVGDSKPCPPHHGWQLTKAHPQLLPGSSTKVSSLLTIVCLSV